MQLKIYDEVGSYEVDTISLDNYDLEDEFTAVELLEIIRDIIEAYKLEEEE